MSAKIAPDNLRPGWLEVRDLVMVRGTKKAVENYLKGKKWGTNIYFFKNGKVSQITKFEKQQHLKTSCYQENRRSEAQEEHQRWWDRAVQS